jgi:nucleolin
MPQKRKRTLSQDPTSEPKQTKETNASEVSNDCKNVESKTQSTNIEQKTRRKQRTETTGNANSKQQVNEPENETANQTQVFIQGISYEANEEMIKELFQNCGEIVAVKMPRYHDSGKPRGYAHIEFSSPEGAQAALKLNGISHLGRYLDVDKPKGEGSKSMTIIRANAAKSRPVGCKTIFIKQLPYDTTEEELRQKFMVFGKIAGVRLALWSDTQRAKGFGYIDFLREESTEIAVKKQHTIQIRGRQLIIDYEARTLNKKGPPHRR